MTKINVDSIGIIGAGPGGLAALYEFLHTNKDGSSTSGGAQAADPAFSKIVAFEQKAEAGGIWTPASVQADLPVPPQHILDSEEYQSPEVVRPRVDPPTGIEGASIDSPVVETVGKHGNELEWSRSGIFPNLFTNIPARFTRYSFMPDEDKYHDKSRKIYPFLHHQELSQRFSNFIEQEQLNKYIRFNTTVEKVEKNDAGKWVVSAKRKNGDKNEWYQEEFDAIVVSNGHYTVPHIPKIPGLAEFNKKHPGVLIHAKSFRGTDEFKDKNVLVVGGSISTANVLQYIVPVAKKTVNSKRGRHYVFEFINDALVSEGITPKGQITKIDPESGEVHFEDGTTDVFEKILFSTGYHYHYPFLADHFKLVNPGNLSRVDGLYLHTFNQADPTLGSAGIAVSQLNFHTIEASAAALAGVWSGAKTLPTVQEQKDWERKDVEEKGDSIFFHYYSHRDAKEKFVDKLAPYFPEGRANPLARDQQYVGEIDEGLEYLKDLFYGLKDKSIKVEETILA
ncbi:flavin-containing monooxygenase [Spathaspora passalidarum NRRL Y-27907]|uniref:Flavin-containing monooxygenase n=1 Tax=Spathaspora passalidarum (strain NRRL Y-27907 / 11-Y1) TaxID=619300 RepID=G3AR06_SPAPN|nr:flavin-containing monooxygenase [Spathaspora passalidarum NRRL Y-27907]EGW31667.1 flavin-containing monooxygenase [Spathaspora passalidarum NRRL Y-27907]